MRRLLCSLPLLIASAAFAQLHCKQISFTGELHNGENYSQQLTAELQFVLAAVGDTGWAFNIDRLHRQPNESDLVYPVTPPYRGPNAQQINTGWGTLAQTAAAHGTRDFEFLLNNADAIRAMDLLNSVLWPGKEDPTKALDEISGLPHGWGNFDIIDSKLTPGTPVPGFSDCQQNKCGHIDFIRFRVVLTARDNFAFSPELHPVPATCPATDPTK